MQPGAQSAFVSVYVTSTSRVHATGLRGSVQRTASVYDDRTFATIFEGVTSRTSIARETSYAQVRSGRIDDLARCPGSSTTSWRSIAGEPTPVFTGSSAAQAPSFTGSIGTNRGSFDHAGAPASAHVFERSIIVIAYMPGAGGSVDRPAPVDARALLAPPPPAAGTLELTSGSVLGASLFASSSPAAGGGTGSRLRQLASRSSEAAGGNSGAIFATRETFTSRD